MTLVAQDHLQQQIRFGGRYIASRDISNIGTIVQYVFATGNDAKALRREQPFINLAMGSVQETLAMYEARASDVHEDNDLHLMSERDRDMLENTLEECASAIKDMRLLTRRFNELPIQNRQSWLDEKQGRAQFELLRKKIEDSGKAINDLTMSMKR